MILLHNELNKLEKYIKTQFYLSIMVIIVLLAANVISYKMGQINQESKVMKRASKLINSDKGCYNSQDLKIVVFGETQE